ncbi:arsenate reductase family protein [Streptomyces gardneri]|uniref:arsenate reductase family protein n=1 Tax=Nocardia TaxID=1817 RepID=UPI00135CD103|nr:MULTISPECIES: arsenate reductase family protein [Nocardia]MBF6169669.1 arsenate reductase family protein [Streptomyces gardneri]MBF6204334.1 arsenate reductase family protein [Streptomyces gardneri]
MTSRQTEIWHNPRCTKSRNATAFLDEAGVDYTVRKYLDQPPTAAELHEVLRRLGAEPWDITRTGEQIAEDLGMASWTRTAADRERWIEALVGHPKLIQRPIVLTADGRAVLARDDATLRDLL